MSMKADQGQFNITCKINWSCVSILHVRQFQISASFVDKGQPPLFFGYRLTGLMDIIS